MKFLKYTLIFALAFASCKTKKNMIDTTVVAKEMSAKKVAKKHIASYFNKQTVDAKLKATYNNGKTKQSFSVSLKIKKDEAIFIKGKKFITVFKAKITPTSVSYYSPYAKHYFTGDFSMIKNLLGVEINFKQLQNLLLGQSLLNVKEEKQEVVIQNNSYVLSPKKQPNLFAIFFAVNPSHFKLDRQSIVNPLKNQQLNILYPTYNLVDDEVYPSKIKITATQANKFTNIDLLLKSVEFNTQLTMPFTIPNGYKELHF